jgi:hypothetical protein
LTPSPRETEDDAPPGAAASLRQLALQCAAAFIVISLSWPCFGPRGEIPPWPETAFAIGGVALLIAALTRQPWWWRLIHAVFAPLLWKASTLEIAPSWFLTGFFLLLFFYRGAPFGRIPLYFSNRATSAALAQIVGEMPDLRFVDLGAGIGSIVRPLARLLPDARVTGIENAPAAWLLGRVNSLGIPNCAWRWGNFWGVSLSNYTVAYAFLSPAPMTALWIKARREMRPGSLFISNSFAVPGITPDDIVQVGDRRQTRLYLYRL